MATQAAKSAGGAEVVNGATVLNGGNVSATDTHVSNSVALLDNLDNTLLYGSKIIAKTGSAFKVGVQTSKGSGALAFFPKRADRSSSAPQFLIRGMATTINNVATDALRIPGSDFFRRAIHIQLSYYNYANSSFDLFATPYETALTKGAVAKKTFVSNTNNSNNATDDAAQDHHAVRGELVYMYGAIIPQQDDYKSFTG